MLETVQPNGICLAKHPRISGDVALTCCLLRQPLRSIKHLNFLDCGLACLHLEKMVAKYAEKDKRGSKKAGLVEPKNPETNKTATPLLTSSLETGNAWTSVPWLCICTQRVVCSTWILWSQSSLT